MGLAMLSVATKSVAVLSGSHLGSHPAYAAAASAFGEAVARAGLRLVYGAGDSGLTELVARAALATGAETMGVIPAHLAAREEAAEGDNPRFVVTETMHERKKMLFMNADAIVALPGGAGTLDHIVEVLTWRQLGLHRKPFFLLNVEGYWDPFLALLEHMVGTAFAERDIIDAIECHETVDELVDRLDARLRRRVLLPN
jgi:uncharacterized protein (TIGR00730 family)